MDLDHCLGCAHLAGFKSYVPEKGPSQLGQLLQLPFSSPLKQVNAPECGHEVQALTPW